MDVDPGSGAGSGLAASAPASSGHPATDLAAQCRRSAIDIVAVVGTDVGVEELVEDVAVVVGGTVKGVVGQVVLCDSTLVATLFAGQRVLDANADAEHFSNRQRRAIAARDRHCVFPGCRRPPRHCDAHHLHERNDDGPTIVGNGCLLCRFHHRLLHQYKWKLRQDDDGWWIAVDPHGQTWSERRPTKSDAA